MTEHNTRLLLVAGIVIIASAAGLSCALIAVLSRDASLTAVFAIIGFSAPTLSSLLMLYQQSFNRFSLQTDYELMQTRRRVQELESKLRQQGYAP